VILVGGLSYRDVVPNWIALAKRILGDDEDQS